MRTLSRRLFVFTSVSLLAAACASVSVVSSSAAWNYTRGGSTEAYRAFVRKYPESDEAVVARRVVKNREDLEAKINAAWPNLKQGMTYRELEREVGHHILEGPMREEELGDNPLLGVPGFSSNATYRIPMDTLKLVLTFRQGRLSSIEKTPY